MEKRKLIKEGNQYWEPNTGNIYNLEGILVAHDCVMRYTTDVVPDINLEECEIIGDSRYAQTPIVEGYKDDCKTKETI